jgi:hypothetical protein
MFADRTARFIGELGLRALEAPFESGLPSLHSERRALKAPLELVLRRRQRLLQAMRTRTRKISSSRRLLMVNAALALLR